MNIQQPQETPARALSSGVLPAYAQGLRLQLPGVTLAGPGRVEVAPSPVCDVASVVLGQLSVPHSCAGGGTLALVHSSDDPVSLMALFVAAVERIGGTVTAQPGGAVVVAGPAGGEATAVQGSGLDDLEGLDGAPLPELDAFVLDDASPATFGAAQAVGGYQRAGLVRPVRDAIDSENVRNLATQLGLDLRVVQLGAASFVVGDEASIAAYDGFQGLSERVVVPVTATGLSGAALAAYRASYPGVAFEHDEAAGSVYLAGLPHDVAIALSALRQVQPATSRVRIEGLFVAYDSGDLRSLETDLNLGPVAASASSGESIISLPFDLVLDQVERASFVQIVARPALTATFGLPAEFRSGGEVPVIAGRDDDGSESVTYREVGITTRFTPTPLTGDLVRLTLEIEISSVAGSGVLNSPSFDVRSVSTVVDLRRGDTVLLSGLSELARSSSRSSSFGLPSSAGSRSDRSLGLFVTLR